MNEEGITLSRCDWLISHNISFSYPIRFCCFDCVNLIKKTSFNELRREETSRIPNIQTPISDYAYSRKFLTIGDVHLSICVTIIGERGTCGSSLSVLRSLSQSGCMENWRFIFFICALLSVRFDKGQSWRILKQTHPGPLLLCEVNYDLLLNDQGSNGRKVFTSRIPEEDDYNETKEDII